MRTLGFTFANSAWLAELVEHEILSLKDAGSSHNFNDIVNKMYT